jgi:hypothetical protein
MRPEETWTARCAFHGLRGGGDLRDWRRGMRDGGCERGAARGPEGAAGRNICATFGRRLGVSAMHLPLRTTCLLLLLASVAALPAAAAIERSLDKTFTVAPGSLVKVSVSGASIHTAVGAAGTAHIVLTEKIRTDDAAQADKLLEGYEISCTQQGDEVTLVVKEKGERRSFGFLFGGGNKVEFHPEITIPADVRIDLDTSGGSISIEGEMAAAVRADTSGGSIQADGGVDLNLDTSGGSIHVRRALGKLRADTSGGSITVDYVGPGATDVNLDTSGGSIHAKVDPTAKLHIVGDTSGGGVHVDGFANFVVEKKDRSHVSGQLNGGGGRLRADTSGGSIRITAVAP